MANFRMYPTICRDVLQIKLQMNPLAFHKAGAYGDAADVVASGPTTWHSLRLVLSNGYRTDVTRVVATDAGYLPPIHMLRKPSASQLGAQTTKSQAQRQAQRWCHEQPWNKKFGAPPFFVAYTPDRFRVKVSPPSLSRTISRQSAGAESAIARRHP
jgi:hypothetical protein